MYTQRKKEKNLDYLNHDKKENQSNVIILKMISILIWKVQEFLLLQYPLIDCSSRLLL